MTAKVKANEVHLRVFSPTSLRFCFVIAALVVTILLPTTVFPQNDDSLFKIVFTKERLVIPCPSNCRPVSGSSCSDDLSLETNLTIVPTQAGFDSKGIWFELTPDKGEVNLAGTSGKWTLRGERPGEYWLRAKVNRGFETLDVVSKSIEIQQCTCTCPVACSSISVYADKNEIAVNQIIMLRVIQSPVFSSSDTIDWNVIGGDIISGAGTRIMKVRANGPAGSVLRINAALTKNGQECRSVAELSVPIIAGVD